MICFAAVYITVWRFGKKRAGGIRMHDRLFIHLPHSCLHLVLRFFPVSTATYLIWSEANLPDTNAKYV